MYSIDYSMLLITAPDSRSVQLRRNELDLFETCIHDQVI